MEGYRCELDWAGYLDFLELLHLGYLGFFFFFNFIFTCPYSPRYGRWIILFPSSSLFCLRGFWQYKRYMRGWGRRSSWATRDPIAERLIRATPFT